MTNNELIEVGFIRAAHGLKGHVVVHAYSGEEESLSGYDALLSQDGKKQYHLSVINGHGTDFLCKVEGISDRTAAELLRGTKLFVPAHALPAPNEDEFYIRDLIGLAVCTASGQSLGKVLNVIGLGAQSAFEIEFVHDVVKALPKPKIEMLLYTKQNILHIDIATRTMTVELPYGLFGVPPLPSGEGEGEGIE